MYSLKRTIAFYLVYMIIRSSDERIIQVLHIIYRIAVNFCELVKNTIFAEKTFADCLLLPHQRMPCSKFRGENFRV